MMHLKLVIICILAIQIQASLGLEGICKTILDMIPPTISRRLQAILMVIWRFTKFVAQLVSGWDIADMFQFRTNLIKSQSGNMLRKLLPLRGAFRDLDIGWQHEDTVK